MMALAEQQAPAPRTMLDLECSTCGYGAARALPERCPMCQREGTWVEVPRRPFGSATALTV